MTALAARLPGIYGDIFGPHYLGYVMARTESEAKKLVMAGRYRYPNLEYNFTFDFHYTPTVQVPVRFTTQFAKETGWIINERENAQLDLHQVLTARYGHPYKVTARRQIETSSGWSGVVHIKSSQEYFANSIIVPEVQDQDDLISKMKLTEVRLMK